LYFYTEFLLLFDYLLFDIHYLLNYFDCMDATKNKTLGEWIQLTKKANSTKIKTPTLKKRKTKRSTQKNKSKKISYSKHECCETWTRAFSITTKEFDMLEEIRQMISEDACEKEGKYRRYSLSNALRLAIRIAKNSRDLEKKLTHIRKELETEDGRSARHYVKN